MKARWLSGPGEIGILQEFNGRAIAEAGQSGYLHPGDIVHRMLNGCRHHDVSRLFSVWEDGAAITAWLMLQPRHDSFDLQIRPDKRGDEFELELLLWAESALLDLLADSGRTATRVTIDVYADDVARRDAAVAGGWHPAGGPCFLTERSTADPPPISLPAGYTLRIARGDEAEAIGALHGAAFGSTWSSGEYAALMDGFGYRPEHEWLVVAPNGSPAGFTETWHDPISGRGLFEPVGVHPDHRRRGVGRALMSRGLTHMAAAGLHTGTVRFDGNNAASRSLYLGAGFEVAHEIACYSKPVATTYPLPVRRER